MRVRWTLRSVVSKPAAPRQQAARERAADKESASLYPLAGGQHAEFLLRKRILSLGSCPEYNFICAFLKTGGFALTAPKSGLIQQLINREALHCAS